MTTEEYYYGICESCPTPHECSYENIDECPRYRLSNNYIDFRKIFRTICHTVFFCMTIIMIGLMIIGQFQIEPIYSYFHNMTDIQFNTWIHSILFLYVFFALVCNNMK